MENLDPKDQIIYVFDYTTLSHLQNHLVEQGAASIISKSRKKTTQIRPFLVADNLFTNFRWIHLSLAWIKYKDGINTDWLYFLAILKIDNNKSSGHIDFLFMSIAKTWHCEIIVIELNF